MIARQYDFDAIQDAQDRHWQEQFVKCNVPREPETQFDFYLDEITEDEETFDTPDGIVLMHNLVEYVRDAIDERVTDLDTAIDTIESVMEEEK